MDTKACWYKVYRTGPTQNQWVAGRFHEWGLETNEAGSYSVGIVEDEETGEIVTPLPESICFRTVKPGG